MDNVNPLFPEEKQDETGIKHKVCNKREKGSGLLTYVGCDEDTVTCTYSCTISAHFIDTMSRCTM